jgi:hypothetical protein
MSKITNVLLVSVIALGLSACATNQATRDAVNAKAGELAKDQFAFEFNCPKEKVQTTMLASGVGASGCDQRKTYMVACPGSAFSVNPDSCYIVK